MGAKYTQRIQFKLEVKSDTTMIIDINIDNVSYPQKREVLTILDAIIFSVPKF